MTLKVGNSQASNLQAASLQQNRAEKIQTNTVAENEAAIDYLANSNLINQSDDLSKSADKTLTVGDFLRKIKTEQPFDDAALSKKQVKVFVSVNKPRTETTLTDYDKATWRAIFKKAGYGMLTDQEIALAVGGMNAVGWTVNDSKFDLENLRKEDAKPGGLVVTTNQAMIERTTRAAQAVLQFREYQSLQADAKKKLAESQTNQMLIDPFRLGGNAVVRWGERILNTPRDILQQIDKGEVMPGTATAKRIGHAIAEKMTGQELAEIPTLSESVKQNTGIELPAIPEITLPRPFEYQSEKYQREGQIGEDVGATAIDLLLLKRGITNSRVHSPQSLKIFETSSKPAKIVAETSILRSPVSINAIEVPRTPNLPKVTTMEELLEIKGVPGNQGVVLNQKTVRNADIWKLSNKNGIEYALTRENGKFVLRSGALDKVRTPPKIRPILHTHPPDELGRFSKLPSDTDIDTLNFLWKNDPNGTRPASMIIWGSEPHQVTIFRATGPFDKLK